MKNIPLYIFVLLLCLAKVGLVSATDTLPDGGAYVARQTDTIPVIDGIGNDNCWTQANWASINHMWIGPAVTPADYSGKYKVLWTPERLYLLVEIVDDTLCLQPPVSDPRNNIYNYECFEIFIDEDNSRETNYSGTYKAIAYHIDSKGGIYYALGSAGWTGSLSSNINYKMTKVADHTYHWEFEIKVFDKSFVYGGNNTPVRLTNNKVMGLSLAYNDNDGGTTRQNMIGSVLVPGTTDAQRNVTYYNASVFGTLTLGFPVTAVTQPTSSDLSQSNAYYSNHKISVQLPYSNTEKLTFQLLDLFGKELKSLTVNSSSKNSVTDVDVSNLPDGIYFARIGNLHQQIVKKVILCN